MVDVSAMRLSLSFGPASLSNYRKIRKTCWVSTTGHVKRVAITNVRTGIDMK
jgi:hypothetical protein